MEQRLVEHTAAGTVLDLQDGQPADLDAMDACGPPRTVRAEVVRALLVDDGWTRHARGVRLRGARVSGRLDLQSATVRCPLSLDSCLLDEAEPVVLDYATASRLSFTGCRMPGLTADLLRATHELDLSRSRFAGPVRMLGADITGQLGLRGSTITVPDEQGVALRLAGVRIGDDAMLDQSFTAHGSVRLDRGDIRGDLLLGHASLEAADDQDLALCASGLRVGGNAFLDDTFSCAGAVHLAGATFDGVLACSGASIRGRDAEGVSVIADRVRVGADACFDVGFTAAGSVRLVAGDVGGQLVLRDARLTVADRSGSSLVADFVHVGGLVLLDGGFTAAGTVRLLGATLAGQVSLVGASLDGRDASGACLSADGVRVGSDLLLSGLLRAAAAIRLAGATVSGRLACTGTSLAGRDGDGTSLVADGLVVADGILLDGGFRTSGAVVLSRAQVTGNLSLTGSVLGGERALVADGCQVSGTLRWAPAERVDGLVDLRGSHVHRLEDDWGDGRPNGHWPRGGRLRLAGFSYDSLGGDHPASWRQRLEWIHGQHVEPAQGQRARFDTQPYEQLVSVYRRNGQDGEARSVEIARRDDLRRYGDLSGVRRAGNWLLGATIRHGYQPYRAVVGLAVVFAAVVIALSVAAHHGVIVPAKAAPAGHPAPTASACTAAYPCFNPYGYAIDVAVPIIKVGQTDDWRPDTSTAWGARLQAGLWVATGLGWAFATLAVAGYTGIIRRD